MLKINIKRRDFFLFFTKFFNFFYLGLQHVGSVIGGL